MKKISKRDQKLLWHPYTQMQTAAPPIAIVKGRGAILTDEQGKKYIDCIASWWQNLHGHSHPYLCKKMMQQAKRLEHVIFANFTHEPAVRLAERIKAYLPDNIARIFYTDNGSTAVEVAVKIAIQFFYNQGIKKGRFIALENGYHGDTFAAMSVASSSIFNRPFEDFLFKVEFIPAPAHGKEAESLQVLEKILAQYDDIAGFIYEPIVQGAAGMRMHNPEGLSALIQRCQSAGIICIADEIMTAFGRTGLFLAGNWVEAKPDIICLSKGITSGMLPLGITACAGFLYEGFLSESREKAFFHGHSCTANPISTSVANASLDLLEKKSCSLRIGRIISQQANFAQQLRRISSAHEVRQCGVIVAFDWQPEHEPSAELSGYIYRYFIRKGLIIRPLGRTIYLLPPYCIKAKELRKAHKEIIKFLGKNHQPKQKDSQERLYF